MDNLISSFLTQIIGVTSTIFLAYFLFRFPRLYKRLNKILFNKREEPQQEAYRSLEELAQELNILAQEFDHAFNETKEIANNRTSALATLETELATLSKKETEMKIRVSELEKVSIPAVEYLLQATEKSERRSAKRDYLLFVAGVVASAVVSIIMRIVFGI